jgi:hypothetical protein
LKISLFIDILQSMPLNALLLIAVALVHGSVWTQPSTLTSTRCAPTLPSVPYWRKSTMVLSALLQTTWKPSGSAQTSTDAPSPSRSVPSKLLLFSTTTATWRRDATRQVHISTAATTQPALTATFRKSWDITVRNWFIRYKALNNLTD